jgi:hypothetical protein
MGIPTRPGTHPGRLPHRGGRRPHRRGDPKGCWWGARWASIRAPRAIKVTEIEANCYPDCLIPTGGRVLPLGLPYRTGLPTRRTPLVNLSVFWPASLPRFCLDADQHQLAREPGGCGSRLPARCGPYQALIVPRCSSVRRSHKGNSLSACGSALEQGWHIRARTWEAYLGPAPCRLSKVFQHSRALPGVAGPYYAGKAVPCESLEPAREAMHAAAGASEH